MARPRKGQKLQEKLDKYLEEYKLDDLNEANDLASLRQMCLLEVAMEKMQAALEGINDYASQSKTVKDLQTSLKDATQSWTSLQEELGINRQKRRGDEEDSPLRYIDKLKSQAKDFVDSRLKVLKCDNCKLPLAKYMIYVDKKGEPSSIESERVGVEDIYYTLKVECSRCGKVVEVEHGRKG